MPHLLLLRPLLCAMSLLFGGLGTIILYLSFAGDSFALSSYAVVFLGAAAVMIRILPE